MSGPVSPAPRNAFIDHLRVGLTVLVILHHVAIAYGGSGGWYWREEPNASNRLLILFNAVNQSYFMGFFFLLAGYYTPAAFDRKGAGRYLADRFLRLGVPMLGYFLVLSPLTIALARTADGHAFWSGWWLMFRLGQSEPGPLWFAEALLIFSVAYAAWRRWIAPTQPAWADLPGPRALALAAVAVAGVSFAVRFVVPVGRNVAWLQLGYFPAYVLLFAAGCLAARERILERVTFAQARPWLVVALGAFIAMPVVIVTRGAAGGFEGGWNFNAAFYALWDPFMAWGVTLGLLWFFRVRLNTTGPIMTYLARQAYGAFIVHPPVVVGVCLLLRAWPAAPLLKFLVAGSASAAGAFAVASLLLRLPPLRRIL